MYTWKRKHRHLSDCTQHACGIWSTVYTAVSLSRLRKAPFKVLSLYSTSLCKCKIVNTSPSLPLQWTSFALFASTQHVNFLSACEWVSSPATVYTEQCFLSCCIFCPFFSQNLLALCLVALPLNGGGSCLFTKYSVTLCVTCGTLVASSSTHAYTMITHFYIDDTTHLSLVNHSCLWCAMLHQWWSSSPLSILCIFLYHLSRWCHCLQISGEVITCTIDILCEHYTSCDPVKRINGHK